MTSNDAKQDDPKPGEQVFEEIGWPWGPEQLELGLAACLALTQENRQDFGRWTYAAFEALRMIGESKPELVAPEKRDSEWGINPREPIEVPWWVIHTLAWGWKKYLEAPPAKTLGETLELEGGGQGKPRFKQIFEARIERMKLALEVAHRREQARERDEKLSVEQAIADVADRFQVSTAKVWDAWKQEKTRARASLERRQASRRNFPKSVP